MNGLGLFALDKDGRLHFDGKEVATRFRLSKWQNAGAIIVTLAAVAGGIGGCTQGIDAGHNFGCKQGWFVAGCRPN
jgi:hypothetical protein